MVVREEGTCATKGVAVVHMGENVCFLTKEDVGGRVLDDVGKIMETIGA